MTESGVRQVFARVTGRLGYRPKVGTSEGAGYTRYGYSIKEIRDLAFSLAQRAIAKPNEDGELFLDSSIEYFGGHTVDPMEYKKIHRLDPDFRKRQYAIVEPYLSPFNNVGNNHVRTDLEKANAKIEQLESRYANLEAMFDGDG